MPNPFNVVEEWEDDEGHEREIINGVDYGYMWPYPTEYIKSVILDSPLKDTILAKHNLSPNDFVELYIIEKNVSGGYSEFTQENDYTISLWVCWKPGERQRLFKTNANYGSNSALNEFLKEYPA